MTNAPTLYSAPIPPWVAVALGEYGITELVGTASNPRIKEYLRSTKLPETYVVDDTPWCSAFINWCMVQSGFKGTGLANARSWLAWGKRLTVPTMGAVAVLWRESPASAKGHVAFFIRRDGAHMWLLSGNQQNKVCIDRYPTSQLLEFRAPA